MSAGTLTPADAAELSPDDLATWIVDRAGPLPSASRAGLHDDIESAIGRRDHNRGARVDSHPFDAVAEQVFALRDELREHGVEPGNDMARIIRWGTSVLAGLREAAAATAGSSDPGEFRRGFTAAQETGAVAFAPEHVELRDLCRQLATLVDAPRPLTISDVRTRVFAALSAGKGATPSPSSDDPCTPDACCEVGQACEHHAPLHGSAAPRAEGAHASEPHPFDVLADGLNALSTMAPGVAMPNGGHVVTLIDWLRTTPCRNSIDHTGVPAALRVVGTAAEVVANLAAEVVGGADARALPPGSRVVRTDDGRKLPKVGATVAEVTDNPRAQQFDRMARYVVLHRGPAAPAPPAIGDVVPDHAAAIALPAGTVLEAADGKRGFVHDNVGLARGHRSVQWSNGARAQYAPDAAVWPATVGWLPGASS